MKVLVTGASGVAGRAVLPRLASAGHDVLGLARSDRAAARVRAAGGTPVPGDVLDSDAVLAAAEGVHAIVHLATAIPPDPAAAGAWDANDAVRITGTQHVCAAAEGLGVRRLVAQSVHYLYGNHGEEWVDESVPVSPDQPSMLQSALDLEHRVRVLSGVEWVILRSGQFFGPGTASDDLIAQASRGRVTVPGDGRRWLSLIHPVDLAQAVELGLTVLPPGATADAVDGRPIRDIDLAAAAARVGATGGALPDVRPDPADRPFGGSLRMRGAILAAAGFVSALPDVETGLVRDAERSPA
jgi:nucleoside-diphosphate-sugar epimerase